MNLKNTLGFMLIVVSLFFSAGQVFSESEITAGVRGTINQVLEIIDDQSLKSDPVLRRKKLRKIIGQRFNYEQMVMRSLAKNYKDRSDAERKEFTSLFKNYLKIPTPAKLRIIKMRLLTM
jgi:ABC-type transporter MlaC component